MSKQNKIHIDLNIRKWDLTALVCGAVAVLMALFFVITAYTPLRYAIPGYPSREMTDQIRNDRMLMDSLQRSLYRWDLYTSNLRKVLEGETPVPLDSLLRQAASASYDQEQTLEMSAADSTLRSIMTEQEIFNIEEEDINDTDIEGRHFFRPLNGVVSASYDLLQHPYLEIVAPDGSSIKSVLDGTVISTDWSASAGWSMIIQHGGIISIYRNCNVLLKKVGDRVSAGTAVAVLGSSEEQGGTGVLRFEMWSSGESVDPAEYIKF